MFHYYQMNQSEFYDHYHKPSNVEATFRMIKAKFGGYLRSKTFVAQANGVRVMFLRTQVQRRKQAPYHPLRRGKLTMEGFSEAHLLAKAR